MLDRLFDAVVAFVMVLFGWVSVGDLSEPAPSEESLAASSYAVVARVIDGDTIDLDNGERVRFLGIDTPEIGECYYAESTEFVRSWLEGETVRLERDIRNRDIYDRLLRYIFIETEPDGSATTTELLVNDWLLASGYAEYLPIGPDRRYRLQFRASFEAAQVAERGRWGECA